MNTIVETDTISISQLLEMKKFTFKMLIVKINDKLVKRENFDKTMIFDQDKVDIIHLISGG